MFSGNQMRYLALYFLWLSSLQVCVRAGENDRVIKIAEKVYARIVSPNGSAVGNSGFVLLGNSVVVFDTHFTPDEGKALRDEIEAITSLPVRYVVNSHYHPDHTHGNQVFRNAHVIGNLGTRRDILEKDLPSLERTIDVTTSQLEKMREELARLRDPERVESERQQIRNRQEYLDTLKALHIVPPLIVFDKYLAIREGDDEARVLTVGSGGHTSSDAVMFLPDQKVVFCGGLFFNTAIPNVQDANILHWMDALQRILELDAAVYIPGHGPPGRRQDVLRFLEYFHDLQGLVGTYIAGGRSLEEAMMEIRLPEKYSGYRFKNLFPSNVQRMYEELKEELLMSIPIEGPQLPSK
jgi:cyclase